MKLTKFQIALLIGIAAVLLVAWIDLQGFNLLGEDYTNGNFPETVWPHHLITTIIIFLIPALCYWIFYRKDKSEVFAIFLSGFIMFYFGLADLFYFIFKGEWLPKTLSWLNGHPIIGKIASIMNSEVTPLVLLTSITLGFIIVYFITKFLKEKM